MDKVKFERDVLALYHHQSRHCEVFKQYLDRIGQDGSGACTLHDLMYLPISFFKTHHVITGSWETQIRFGSSGTGDVGRSWHAMPSLMTYLNNATQLWEYQFGSLKDVRMMAILPGYRPGSSLIAMIQHFIKQTEHTQSRIYKTSEYDQLALALQSSDSMKTVLFGVTHGILDFCTGRSLELPNLVVMETGGMKGRKKELLRSEVHEIIRTHLGTPHIYSEYGMTELSSQAYTDQGLFFMPNEMLAAVPGDIYDPLGMSDFDRTCRLNIIDLANVHSCAFIATEDVGIVQSDGSFRVMGRLDLSETRGCALMMA